MSDLNKPKPTPKPSLLDDPAYLKKQRQGTADMYNKTPDPVGDFVRRIIKGNKEKKKEIE